MMCADAFEPSGRSRVYIPSKHVCLHERHTTYPDTCDGRGVRDIRRTEGQKAELEKFCTNAIGDINRKVDKMFDGSMRTHEQEGTMIESIGDAILRLFSYCYEHGRIIIADRDDDCDEHYSRDLVCDGNCERCPA